MLLAPEPPLSSPRIPFRGSRTVRGQGRSEASGRRQEVLPVRGQRLVIGAWEPFCLGPYKVDA